MISPGSSPVATFIAAISDTVPCRTYPNSRPPGPPRRVGCLRGLAWMPVFSSMPSSAALGGGMRGTGRRSPWASRRKLVLEAEPAADQVRLDVRLADDPVGRLAA
jgi:hypothetical protein